jgi:hypothetical protein
MNFAAYYSIALGILMIIQWLFFIFTGSVPDFSVTPIEISIHIFIEILTAVILIIGGMKTLKTKSIKLNLVGLGMVLYAMINASGYFAQLNQWIFVAMFAVLLLFSLYSLKLLWKGVTNEKNQL